MNNENDAVTTKKAKPEPEPLIIASFETGRDIAYKLIPEHHPHLASANIIFLCRNKAQKSGDSLVPGTVKKTSPIERYIGGFMLDGDREPHFIMTIALEVWNELQPSQRIALIDHLLTRCHAEENENDGSMKYSIRKPQVQEFPEVAERHGKWNDGLVELGDSLRGK